MLDPRFSFLVTLIAMIVAAVVVCWLRVCGAFSVIAMVIMRLAATVCVTVTAGNPLSVGFRIQIR